jgi:chaperonin GroEL (HSP60 family)
MVAAGLKAETAGANPMDLKRGINKAVTAVIGELRKQSETIGEDFNKIQQVVAISANNDEERRNPGFIRRRETLSTGTKKHRRQNSP